MKDNINFTIPMDYNALTCVAKMLTELAETLATTGNIVGGKQTNEIDASVVFDKKVVPLQAAPIPAPQAAPIPTPQAAPIPPAPVAEIPAPQAAPAGSIPGSGVELDSDGLPWDARIHGAKKLKLAKTQQWKKKRGIDPVVVETVETELRAAMAAPGASVETIVDDTHPPMPNTPAPVPPAPPTGITFPELMSKITTAMGAGTVTEAMVTLACNNQGVASLALLAVRPDLIPYVDAELFPS